MSDKGEKSLKEEAELERTIDKLIGGDFIQLERLFNSIEDGSQHSQLAGSIISLCEECNQLIPLQEWIWSNHLSSSPSSPSLRASISSSSSSLDSSSYHSNGLAMKTMMQRLYLNDHSLRWISIVLSSLIERFKSIDLPSNLNASKKEWDEQDCKVLSQLGEIFIEELTESVVDCPLTIRRGWLILDGKMRESSRIEQKNPPSIQHFFQFLDTLLGIASSQKGMAKEDEDKVQLAFNLIQDCILKEVEFKHHLLLIFADSHRGKVMEFYKELIGKEEIQMVESIVKAQQIEKNAARVLVSKQQLMKFFDSVVNRNESSLPANVVETLLSKNEMKTQVKLLSEKMDSQRWKLEKKWPCGSESFTTKFGNRPFLAVKVVSRIRAELLASADFYSWCDPSEYYDPKNITKAWRTRITEDTEHIFLFNHPPWPTSKRQCSYRQTTIPDIKNRTVYLVKERMDCERQKGYIRSNIYLGGVRLVEDQKDPSFIIITSLIDVDPGGSVPAWGYNLATSSIAQKFVKMASHCESKERDFHLEQVKSECISIPDGVSFTLPKEDYL
eukprot:TRINITY_DN7386_c0_g1_i1.p1 TRINITY_DN7386_c0_g1~~TRINITY_DN7386_c0_g1_i1.p1  ORF type:complete len:557 (+),score=173.44 TRINITY_DN7386_c0_g1_i1:75-1745(+)